MTEAQKEAHKRHAQTPKRMEYMRKWKNEKYHSDPETRARIAAYHKEYRKKNREKRRAWAQSEKEKARRRKHYQEVLRIKQGRADKRGSVPKYPGDAKQRARASYRAYRDRNKSDPLWRMKMNMRTRLGGIFGKLVLKKAARTVELIGCSWQHLRDHLESKFRDGMSWENNGRTGWVIDHIKPISLFDLSDPEQQKLACHWTNLQPLWNWENIRKSDNYDPSTQTHCQPTASGVEQSVAI